MLRSPFAPASLALLAVLAGGIRWLAQGTQNVYTALAQRFYIPDPDFGWREAQDRPLWLGLEVLALLAAALAATSLAALWIRRREQRSQRRASVLRALAWAAATVALVPPIAAFASGAGPAQGRLTLPAGATAAAPREGIEGQLSGPAGSYEVVAHRGTVVTAKISAGGDVFDARFDRDVAGTWQLTPSDLSKPMTAEISVATAAVDTGIELRSEHARAEYLQAGKHPRIAFRLRRVVATRQDGSNRIIFRGRGDLQLVGVTSEVEVTGTVEVADDAKRTRLELGDRSAILLVQAEFVLPLARSGLTPSDYDTDKFPLQISLVLAHRN